MVGKRKRIHNSFQNAFDASAIRIVEVAFFFVFHYASYFIWISYADLTDGDVVLIGDIASQI